MALNKSLGLLLDCRLLVSTGGLQCDCCKLYEAGNGNSNARL